MKKGKKKIVSIITVAAILFVAFCIGGFALSSSDNAFYKNTPTYIKMGVEVKSVINKPKDYDAYMFDVPSSGALKLNFTHENAVDSAKIGWVITLYKMENNKVVDYTEIAKYDALWSEASSTWSELGVTPGTYLVIVKPGAYLRESEYHFQVHFNKNTIYEGEPNDSRDRATNVEVGYGKYGVSSRKENVNDIDWYKFSISNDSTVNITITHPNLDYPQVGWTVTLVNENGDKITQFVSRLRETIIKTGAIGLRAGNYYLSVESQSEFSDTYTILVGADLAENTEFELNDTPETSIPLPQNYEISGCLADRMIALDKDYYKITVPADGILNVSFVHNVVEKNNDGWNVRVYKPLGDGKYYQIAKKISKWNESRLEIRNLGVEKGDYYICIDGDSLVYNSETYYCKWNFIETQNYEKEPNNTRISANLIQIGQKYGGIINSSEPPYDDDYYRFELSEDSTVLLEFGHEKKEGSNVCWYASIVDEDDFEMCSVGSELSSGLVSTDVTELPPGVYYVKIETGDYGSDIPYHFKVTTSGIGK